MTSEKQNETKSKRVRQPKKVREVKTVEKEPRAKVTLIGCASLRRHGLKFTMGESFFVIGQDKVDYFKGDSRFEVLDQK